MTIAEFFAGVCGGPYTVYPPQPPSPDIVAENYDQFGFNTVFRERLIEGPGFFDLTGIPYLFMPDVTSLDDLLTPEALAFLNNHDNQTIYFAGRYEAGGFLLAGKPKLITNVIGSIETSYNAVVSGNFTDILVIVD